MAWQRHCHPANPCWVLAVLALCVILCGSARCSRPLEEGPHKRPGDWQKRKCLASRLLQISSPIRGSPRCPGRWRAMRRGWATCAESKADIREGQSPHQVLTWSHQVCLVYQRPTARMVGVIPKKSKERGIVERKKTGAEKGMEIGRSLSSRGAKRRCAVSPAKPQFPYEVEPPGGGLSRDHSTHAPPSRSRPCRRL